MAEAAAIINRAGPSDSEAFDAALAEYSPEVRRLAQAVRGLVFEALPQTVEVVWPKQRTVGWGIGPRKFSEQFCYLLPFRGHVTLGFYYGGELPDPAGLLGAGGRQVSGKLSMRSLRIEKLQVVQQPELRELVEAAVRQIGAG